ncbi:MAG: hypothetical protein M3Q97_10550, partial [Bacteroidota bacterium]|nr:hypothetical protein [Bacteroidota bacterium]
MEAVLLHCKDISYDAWDALVNTSPQRNPFVHTWYLDAIGEDWYGIVVSLKGEWQAVMPMIIRNKILVKYAWQPILTKYWGPVFRHENYSSDYKLYAWQAGILEVMLKAVPSSLKSIRYVFHPSFDYALPFHWAGYNLGLRYSYVLPLDKNVPALRKKFKPSLRNRLNNAERLNYFISVEDDT